MSLKNLIHLKKKKTNSEKNKSEEIITEGEVQELRELALGMNRDYAMQSLCGLPCWLGCFY